MKKKKIAVIGGAGFIGKQLCVLLSKKYYVVNIDLKTLDKVNIQNITLDIYDEKKLTKSLKNIDYVFHFAGISDLNKCLQNPKKTAQSNVIGTINVLNACKKNNVKKIIFSSSLYSFTEEGGFYKSSKLSAEFFIYEYFKRYKLKYTILRFGSIYGEGSNFDNGLFRIVYNALKDKKISFEGSKKTIRRFINVKDVAILTSKTIQKKYDNKIVMITGNYLTKITDVFKKVKKIVGIEGNNAKILFKQNSGHYIKKPQKFKFPKIINLTKNNHVSLDTGLKELKSYILKNFDL